MIYKSFLLGLLVVVLVLEARGRLQMTNKDNTSSKLRNVQKRNLIQFGTMVYCMTGRFSLDYNNYGSYCGFGGSGIPVDEVDRCCQVHDQCYGKYDKCFPYTATYKVDSSGWYPTCSLRCGDTDPCKQAVCNCDKAAAECFAKHKYNYNNNNSWFNWFK